MSRFNLPGAFRDGVVTGDALGLRPTLEPGSVDLFLCCRLMVISAPIHRFIRTDRSSGSCPSPEQCMKPQSIKAARSSTLRTASRPSVRYEDSVTRTSMNLCLHFSTWLGDGLKLIFGQSQTRFQERSVREPKTHLNMFMPLSAALARALISMQFEFHIRATPKRLNAGVGMQMDAAPPRRVWTRPLKNIYKGWSRSRQRDFGFS